MCSLTQTGANFQPIPHWHHLLRMDHNDHHLSAVRSISRRAIECLYLTAGQCPEQAFPLSAHFRVIDLSGKRCVTVSISSPVMEIGLSHTPKSNLASDIQTLLSNLTDLPLEDIDLTRLNTSNTIRHYKMTCPPSAHDLIEIMSQPHTEPDNDPRL